MQHSPIYAFIKQVTPTESRVLMASENYGDLTDIPGSKMVGKSMGELFPAEFAATMAADDWAVVSGGKVLHLDENFMGRNYTTIKFPILLGGKRLLAGYTIDITERVWAEKKIRAMNAELEQRVEERTRDLHAAQEQLLQQERLAVLGQLASGVSHELRNPLGVILNAVYYLRLVQPEANDKIRQYHSMIEYEAHNAEKIVNDLLDFARIKQSNREWVVVSDLLDQTLERHPAPESVAVSLDFPPDLPKVFADPHQMEQVLGNLIVNACQAMSNGGNLTISAAAQDDFIAISVKDTGVGIPPENMKKLFEPLFTTKAKSIGLGLALSQKLIDANGGKIEVESETGKGSTFTVYLPVKP
jgi:signal transduction histidine kinase